jgi:hypothetical protein
MAARREAKEQELLLKEGLEQSKLSSEIFNRADPDFYDSVEVEEEEGGESKQLDDEVARRSRVGIEKKVVSKVGYEEKLFKKTADVTNQIKHITASTKYGDFFYLQDDHVLEIVEAHLMQKFPTLDKLDCHFKVAYLHSEQLFNVFICGEQAPVSFCCNLAMCFQFDAFNCTCKLVCLENLCQYNPLKQFPVPLFVMAVLFPDKFH